MNCIWITVDSFRQDHVHCYHPSGTSDPGGTSLQVRTPRIDQFAREGVLFERLRMEALPTVCARRGIFTGRRIFPFADEPTHKGMYITIAGWRPLPQSDVTVAEHLSESGYVCGMICDVYHLMKPSQNFHRGFQCFQWIRGQEYDMYQSQPLPEGYVEQFLKPGSNPSLYRNRVLTQYLRNQFYREGEHDFQAAKTFRAAIQWLERNHQHEQFFLYVDSFDPHEPNEAPKRFLDLYGADWDGPKLIYGNPYRRDELTAAEHHNIRARYAAEASMVDYWIGELLDAIDRLGRRDDTLVILLSDHGKILGEWNHYGMPPQDTGLELNRVPCIIRHPTGQGAGTRFGDWVYNVDVTATVLHLLGAGDKPMMDGRDFWPALGTDGEFRREAVVGHGQMISCWHEDWLYLINTQENQAALYNLADEPSRETDLADRYPSVRDDLRRRVEAVTGS